MSIKLTCLYKTRLFSLRLQAKNYLVTRKYSQIQTHDQKVRTLKMNLKKFALGIALLIFTCFAVYTVNTAHSRAEKAQTENATETTATPQTEEATIKTPDGIEIFPVIGLGDPKAPVYLVEYASLSCTHCAEFHQSILPRLKEDYIDQGKVFIEFRDYPTSKSGLDATMLTRCMDKKRQYKFMDLLFQTQDMWAFTEDQTPLFQNAKLAGMNQEAIDKCLADDVLKQQVLDTIKRGQQRYSVSSTPTVIAYPTNEKMKGLTNYKTIQKQIDRALKAAEK
jgi:protein-disulfide isomerase